MPQSQTIDHAVVHFEGKKFNEPPHAISTNVVFGQVKTQTRLCSLFLVLETPNNVQSVA